MAEETLLTEDLETDQTTETVETEEEEGIEYPKWMTQGSAKYIKDPDFTKFEKIKDLQKEYKALLEKSKKSIIVPDEDADDEAREEFYSKLGRPESADKYDFSDVDIPKGMKKDEESEKAFKEAAFKLGLSNTQANTVYAHFMKLGISTVQALKEAGEISRKAAEEELKKELGKKYEGEKEYVRRVLKSFAPKGFAEYLIESGLGNDPRMFRFIARVGKLISEDEFVGGKEGTKTEENDGTFSFPGLESLE